MRKVAGRLDPKPDNQRKYSRELITFEVCIDSQAAEEKLARLKAELNSVLELSAKVNS